MKRAYKYRIYPTEEQKKYFELCFNARCWFWNYALEKKLKAYDENKGKDKKDRDAIPSALYHIKKDIPSLKKQESTSWLVKVDSRLFCGVCDDLDKAFKRFFKDENFGLPKYKKRKYANSFKSDVHANEQNIIEWEGVKRGRIRLPKIGYVECVFHRKFEGTIKSVTVSKKSFDYYEISILVDDNFKPYEKEEHTYEGTVGIDMGVKKDSNAILSNGTKLEGVDVTKLTKKIKRLKRKLSKKQWFGTGEKRYSRKYKREVEVEKPSRNYIKLKNKIAKLEDKIARKRVYNTHQITSYLTKSDTFDTIAIENLNVKEMVKMKKVKNKKKKHACANAVSNANMGEMKRQLTYKSEWYGKNLVMVDRYFPSSQLCSKCGYRNTALKDVNVREWTCPVCGTHHDRDINAAINIREDGNKILSKK